MRATNHCWKKLKRRQKNEKTVNDNGQEKSILLKWLSTVINRFSKIPINIPIIFLWNRKKIIKCLWKKGHQMDNTVFIKKNKAGCITLPHLENKDSIKRKKKDSSSL